MFDFIGGALFGGSKKVSRSRKSHRGGSKKVSHKGGDKSAKVHRGGSKKVSHKGGNKSVKSHRGGSKKVSHKGGDSGMKKEKLVGGSKKRSQRSRKHRGGFVRSGSEVNKSRK
jgi:hypothetical protein